MDLVREVTALLGDPAPEVRRTAMLAVGPLNEAIPTDRLLAWLHDPDADVRRLCEAALLAREDFQPEHLTLARLITAPEASVRLQVLAHLQHDSSLEPGIWLRRLGRDPAPEVRAAAVRAAANQPAVDLSDLIRERAQADPSQTVSQLAGYYLRALNQKKGRP
jgi:HEAT repeat protein